MLTPLGWSTGMSKAGAEGEDRGMRARTEGGKKRDFMEELGKQREGMNSFETLSVSLCT